MVFPPFGLRQVLAVLVLVADAALLAIGQEELRDGLMIGALSVALLVP